MIAKNNPFNIRYDANNNWLGQVGSYKGFCVFKAEEYGIRACMCVIRSYNRKNILTVEGIITRFAPPTENVTDKYIAHVVKTMRAVNPSVHKFYSVVPGSMEYFAMLSAMAFVETATFIGLSRLEDVYNTYIMHK